MHTGGGTDDDIINAYLLKALSPVTVSCYLVHSRLSLSTDRTQSYYILLLVILEHAYFLFCLHQILLRIITHSTHGFQKWNRGTFIGTISLHGLFDTVRGLEVQSKPFWSSISLNWSEVVFTTLLFFFLRGGRAVLAYELFCPLKLWAGSSWWALWFLCHCHKHVVCKDACRCRTFGGVALFVNVPEYSCYAAKLMNSDTEWHEEQEGSSKLDCCV